MTSPDNSVELVRDKKWTVRITAYGSTLTFPFEAESYARSYADGQAFRLGVQVAELKRCGCHFVDALADSLHRDRNE